MQAKAIRRRDGRVTHKSAVAAFVIAAAAAAPIAVPQALAQNALSALAGQSISQPVVQAIPGADGMALNAALARLGRNPRDIEALIDAGNAALVMGDVDAATGFFRRADQVSPNNPRVKAGLAGAMVRNGDPFGAIPLFEQAEKVGALDSALAADRGLAFDLVGDSASAQRYYQQTLARGANDEVSRRLALSQAIAGDRRGMEATLTPLLQRQDKAAWRTRAFALAILGQTEEAVRIARTVLPADIASAIAPYMRYMPRLTPAQQAAAANFGAFPAPSEIGRDDPRVAQYAPAISRRPTVAAAGSALVPRGEALGRSGSAAQSGQAAKQQSSRQSRPLTRRQRAEQARLAAAERQGPTGPLLAVTRRTNPAPDPRPEPQPRADLTPRVAPGDVQPGRGTEASAQSVVQPAPRVAALTVRQTPAAAVTPRPTVPPPTPTPTPTAVTLPPVAQQATPAQPPAATPSPVVNPPVSASAAGIVDPPGPRFDLGQLPSRQTAEQTPPESAAPPPVPTPSRVSLSEAFAEFTRPAGAAAPSAGAVDISRLTPPRPKVERPAPKPAAVKPPPPSHPSRIWVQVGTGRDKSALAGDWRRMNRATAAAFRDMKGFITAWGQSNRLLTGPFASEAAANTFINQLRRADVIGPFLWTSPAGQVVDALAEK